MLSFDGNRWYAAPTPPPLAITGTPSLAYYSGSLYCAYPSSANSIRLTSFQSTTWGSDNPVPQAVTSRSPAITAFQTTGGTSLYLFNQGDNDGILYYSVLNGSTWTVSNKPVPNAPGMSESPAVAVYNGKLYCIYQAYGRNGYVSGITFDGTTW